MSTVAHARRMSEGHPALAAGHLDAFLGILDQQPDDMPRVDRLLSRFGRLVDVQPPKDIVVVGCGPRPQPMKVLEGRGYRVVGVEPVPSFVREAAAYLGEPGRVREGCAEAMPVESSACDLVLCENVLEHVDSPRAALDEMHRVLRPGGIAFVTTTNRLRLSLHNSEFNVRFFNWLPSLVRESYVFQHLHYQPSLANQSLRPAVHWFTFAELCRLGRESGFGQFYSPLDLFGEDEAFATGKGWKRVLVKRLQRNPWLRALALTQMGHDIVMLKRP